MNNQEEKEIWLDIPEYEGRYQVSNLGRVKTFHLCPEGKIMELFPNRLGYIGARLYKGGEVKHTTVHRLVALMFVPNPYFYKEINHKDGNKENNRWDNLEWCTRSDNMIHAFATGLKENRKGSESNAAKRLFQFDKNGNLIREWGSLVECAEYLSKLEKEKGNVYPAEDIRKNLTATLHDRHKSCCGFLFSFENTIDAESKKKDLGQKAVIAVPVKGIRGNRTWDENKEGAIRFSYVNETEGYVMPNGKKACAALVSKCCLGKRDTHAGYKWRFETDDEFKMNKKPKVVLQIDSVSGEIIKRWEKGVTEIAQELGLANNSGISRCLWDETGHEKCLGCFWRYEV